MNKFVFITHVTPAAKRNPLRQRLLDLYHTALKNQTYSDWIVVQLHEGPDEVEGQFHRFHLPDVSREEKNDALKKIFSREDFLSLLNSSDYLVKLDDDDLISPVILEQLAGFKGDLFYDRDHTFYDISSGVFTQQSRTWVASTCVHKTEHALAAWSGEGASSIGNLLYTDHSKAWHRYYSDKKIVKADPMHPVYARVLSPTSITSGGKSVVRSFADVNMQDYHLYLRSFGDWKLALTKDFDVYRAPLSEAWLNFSGKPQEALPAKGFREKLTDKMRALKNKLMRNE